MAADSLERGLVAYLGTKAALMALVGQRIYPQMGPQSPTFPYLTYHRIGTDRRHGLGKGDRGPLARLEMTAWGGKGPPGYDTAKGLAAVLVPILEGYRGAAGNWFVHSLFVVDEFDVTESPE